MASSSQIWSILKVVAISYLMSGLVQQYLVPESVDMKGGAKSAAPASQVATTTAPVPKKATRAAPLSMLADMVKVDFGFECLSGEALSYIPCDKLSSAVADATPAALPAASGASGERGSEKKEGAKAAPPPLPGRNYWTLQQRLESIHGTHNALINVEDVFRHNVTVRLVATVTSNRRTVKRFLDLVRYIKPPKSTKKLFGDEQAASAAVVPAAAVRLEDHLPAVDPTQTNTAIDRDVVSNALATVAPLSSEPIVEPTAALPWIQKFLPTVEFSCVAEATLFNPVPQPLEDTLDIDEHGRYFPICEFKTFWVIDSQFVTLNATTALRPAVDEVAAAAEPAVVVDGEEAEGVVHHPRGFINFTIDVTNGPLWKYLVFTQMDKSFSMHQSYGTMGSKEMDETKRIFLDTNPWLLGLTFAVSMLHLLFEYLAFSNDVKFWKGRKNFTGLSLKSVVMEFYFSLVIFLYLFDGEETSYTVLAPSGIGVLIAFWKIKKAIVVTNIADDKATTANAAAAASSTTTSAVATVAASGAADDGMIIGGTWRVTFAKSYQSKTKEHDDVAMKYLMYAMVPCLAAYTIYSALYEEHKGWYSFVIGTQVRFIYFFGFAMMTPQIFINYKLKSVTALPWRTFVYKALNTFIDDLFAFIIKMPMMHRLACFRDDIVFLILLYQRWIYPVDEKRSENGDDDEDEEDEGAKANGSASNQQHQQKVLDANKVPEKESATSPSGTATEKGKNAE